MKQNQERPGWILPGQKLNDLVQKRKQGREMISKQLALDYCCSVEDVKSPENIFSVYHPLEGRRRFREPKECLLKIASTKNKLLFTGREDIIGRCRQRYEKADGAWFMEAKSMAELNLLLSEYDYQIKQIHPFYISLNQTDMEDSGYQLQYYDHLAIEQFRGDERFEEAYSFEEEAPDEIGIAAIQDGEILAMAGASGDSPMFWQIGINVLPEARGRGLGTLLVTLLKNEILERGKIPYYGTAVSHVLSQNIAIASGFEMAWTELITDKK